MKDPKTGGIVLAALGLLVFCTLCPLVLNNLVLIGTSGGRPQDVFNLYSKIFPAEARFGNIFLSTIAITLQESCATVLGIAILIIGAMMFTQARQSSKPSKKSK